MRLHHGAPVFEKERRGKYISLSRNYPRTAITPYRYNTDTDAYCLRVTGLHGTGTIALSEAERVEMFQTFLEIRETYVHP